MLFCAAPENEEQAKNWSRIIKNLEIILASSNPDSTKAVKIKILFDTNQVSLAEYREFYEKSMEQDPVKNLSYLKEIEQLISKDMKTEAQRQKKIGETIDLRPGKKKTDSKK
jgi:hypothetical protein